MEALYFFCVAILCAVQVQAIPLSIPPCPPAIPPCPPVIPPCPPVIPPCPPVITPCQPSVITSPVIATTIIDNSVSNALANAIQLLIVSNLIENTMNCPCGLHTLPAPVTPICDPFPYQTSMYSPAIEVITPEYFPYLPFDPIIKPCDFIAPCEPVFDIIPNMIYPEMIPNIGCGCGCDSPFLPNCGCGCLNFPNICNCGCNNYPRVANILPIPNIGCGCNNCGCDINPFGPLYACDQCGPILPDVVFPSTISPQVNCGCGCGGPNYPIGVCVDPWVYDPCPNRCLGNNYYY